MKSRILLTVLTAFLAVACSEYPSGLRTDLMLDTSQPDGALIRSAKARPFNTTFNRQVIHARNLCGPQLHIPKFTAEELRLELEEPLNYYAQRDRGFIADRVCQTILTRQKEQNKE